MEKNIEKKNEITPEEKLRRKEKYKRYLANSNLFADEEKKIEELYNLNLLEKEDSDSFIRAY